MKYVHGLNISADSLRAKITHHKHVGIGSTALVIAEDSAIQNDQNPARIMRVPIFNPLGREFMLSVLANTPLQNEENSQHFVQLASMRLSTFSEIEFINQVRFESRHVIIHTAAANANFTGYPGNTHPINTILLLDKKPVGTVEMFIDGQHPMGTTYTDAEFEILEKMGGDLAAGNILIKDDGSIHFIDFERMPTVA